MKKRYVVAITGLLFLQLSAVRGQSEIGHEALAEVCLQKDSVINDTVKPDEGLLPVSECGQRAQFIKDAVSDQRVKKSSADKKGWKKRMDVAEVKCDSPDIKIPGVPDKLNERVPVAEEQSVARPFVIQVCVLTNPMKETLVNGKPLALERVNGYYRYFLEYVSLEDAQHALDMVRWQFPDAFIRKAR